MTSSSLSTGLILFAHGSRDPAWADPLRRVQAEIVARVPQQRVELAFLEWMAPTLSECVGRLHDTGVTRAIVVPMFIAQGGHLKNDLPKLLQELRCTYPEMTLSLTPAIGEIASVIEAMANAALMTLMFS